MACSLRISRRGWHEPSASGILVHGYADVDDRLVVAQLDRVSELERFVEAVSRWSGGE